MDRRRMKDLREEVGTKACIVGKIVKSRIIIIMAEMAVV